MTYRRLSKPSQELEMFQSDGYCLRQGADFAKTEEIVYKLCRVSKPIRTVLLDGYDIRSHCD